jgi:hypothetical protein
VDPKAHPYVLLEAVALGAHQSPQSSGVGDKYASGDSDGDQQQKLLAPVQDLGDTNRDDECLAEKPGLDIRPCALDACPRAGG